MDLNSATLYGQEPRKNAFVIDSLVKGIEAGDSFPPVPIELVGLQEYRIIWQGHHRAVAHYIAGVPLVCELDARRVYRYTGKEMRIGDIELIENFEGFQARKERDSNYR